MFVGIREFRMGGDGTGLPAVDFAVDDAVDLAYLFAIELGLVEPEQVQLLLSGDPEKPASKEHLKCLIAKGAQKFPGSRSDILSQLRYQADAAGSKGLLIVTFASHGIHEGGSDYLLTSDSIKPFLKDTALGYDIIFDVASQAETSRRIILIDTCREVIKPGSRGASPDPSFSMSRELVRRISNSEGDIILTAARAGGYAYPDPERGNGVFTAAVLDTLRCKIEPGSQGLITAGDLAKSVNQRVTDWVKQHKPGSPRSQRGITFSLGGTGAEMVLSMCSSLTPETPVRRPVPAIPVPPMENSPCKGVQLVSVEIYLGAQGIRRMAPTQNVLSLKTETLGDLQNLTGRAILSRSCSCRWEQFDPQTRGWTELEQGGGCSFSMPPPRRQTSLRLTLGDRTLPPILLDVQ